MRNQHQFVPIWLDVSNPLEMGSKPWIIFPDEFWQWDPCKYLIFLDCFSVLLTCSSESGVQLVCNVCFKLKLCRGRQPCVSHWWFSSTFVSIKALCRILTRGGGFPWFLPCQFSQPYQTNPVILGEFYRIQWVGMSGLFRKLLLHPQTKWQTVPTCFLSSQ